MALSVVVLLLALTTPGGAQSKPVKLSDRAMAEIRTLQLRQAQLTIQAQQLLAQYQAEKVRLDAEIKAAEERALKDAGADPTKYNVNDQSLEVESRTGSVPVGGTPNRLWGQGQERPGTVQGTDQKQ